MPCTLTAGPVTSAVWMPFKKSIAENARTQALRIAPDSRGPVVRRGHNPLPVQTEGNGTLHIGLFRVGRSDFDQCQDRLPDVLRKVGPGFYYTGQVFGKWRTKCAPRRVVRSVIKAFMG